MNDEQIKQLIKNGKKAFKALAKRYASITMEEIEVAEKMTKNQMCLATYGYLVAGELTNFGTERCTLCAAASEGSCSTCNWVVKTTYGCGNHSTYKGIYNAKDKVELKAAFKARSEYMNEFL